MTIVLTEHTPAHRRLIAAAEVQGNLFPALRKQVADEGLFEKRPLRSIVALVLTTIAFGVGIGLLTVIQNIPFLLLDAVYLALVCAQFGYLMHDAGHRQVFRSTFANDVFGYFATFFNGTSFFSWYAGHNEHHNHPNQEDLDPDVDVYFLRYTEQQIDDANPFIKYMARYQAWYALGLYCLVSHFMRYGSIPRLIQRGSLRTIALDLSMMTAWHISYYGGLLYVLGFWKAVLFCAVHQSLVGLHLALAFAPNHKGMPMFQKDANLDWFTRQVVTARNIYASPFMNFLYGGLNLQIEHHLFPTMPRMNYVAAQKITKKYCAEHNVDYHETSIMNSYKEVFALLADIARYARNLSKPVPELQTQLSTLANQLKTELNALSGITLYPNTHFIRDRIQAMAAERLEKIERNRDMRKEQNLRYQREMRELIAATRRLPTLSV
jgi:fatty acid desaturase